MRRPSTARALTAIALTCLMFAQACGSDDSDDAGSTADELTAFCDPALEAVSAFGSGADPAEPIAAALSAAPDPLGSKLSSFVDAAEAAEAGEDDSAFLASPFRAQAYEVFSGIAEACDFNTVDIDAVEYAFEGLPDTLPAGPTQLHLTARGAEVHELIVYRRAAGAEGDLVTILDEDPNVEDGRLEESGVALPVAPGDDSALLLELVPGDYVAVCWFPTGITSFEQLQNFEGSDSDHRAQGMVRTFTVT